MREGDGVPECPNPELASLSSDAPPPLVQQKFKFLASSIVQVSMSSTTRCDAVSVSFQLDAHIAEVLAGVTLSVMPLNAGMSEVFHDLHGLLRPVPLHRRPIWNASFPPVGCSILDDEELRGAFKKFCNLA